MKGLYDFQDTETQRLGSAWQHSCPDLLPVPGGEKTHNEQDNHHGPEFKRQDFPEGLSQHGKAPQGGFQSRAVPDENG